MNKLTHPLIESYDFLNFELTDKAFVTPMSVGSKTGTCFHKNDTESSIKDLSTDIYIDVHPESPEVDNCSELGSNVSTTGELHVWPLVISCMPFCNFCENFSIFLKILCRMD